MRRGCPKSDLAFDPIQSRGDALRPRSRNQAAAGGIATEGGTPVIHTRAPGTGSAQNGAGGPERLGECAGLPDPRVLEVDPLQPDGLPGPEGVGVLKSDDGAQGAQVVQRDRRVRACRLAQALGGGAPGLTSRSLGDQREGLASGEPQADFVRIAKVDRVIGDALADRERGSANCGRGPPSALWDPQRCGQAERVRAACRCGRVGAREPGTTASAPRAAVSAAVRQSPV